MKKTTIDLTPLRAAIAAANTTHELLLEAQREHREVEQEIASILQDGVVEEREERRFDQLQTKHALLPTRIRNSRAALDKAVAAALEAFNAARQPWNRACRAAADAMRADAFKTWRPFFGDNTKLLEAVVAAQFFPEIARLERMAEGGTGRHPEQATFADVHAITAAIARMEERATRIGVELKP